jgi:hypothetical protein
MPPNTTRSDHTRACTLACGRSQTHNTSPAARTSRASGDWWRTARHERGVCAVRGVCGARLDRDPLDCPANQPAAAPDATLAAALARTCPSVWAAGGGAAGTYCCTADQVAAIASSVRACVRVACVQHRKKFAPGSIGVTQRVTKCLQQRITPCWGAMNEHSSRRRVREAFMPSLACELLQSCSMHTASSVGRRARRQHCPARATQCLYQRCLPAADPACGPIRSGLPSMSAQLCALLVRWEVGQCWSIIGL